MRKFMKNESSGPSHKLVLMILNIEHCQNWMFWAPCLHCQLGFLNQMLRHYDNKFAPLNANTSCSGNHQLLQHIFSLTAGSRIFWDVSRICIDKWYIPRVWHGRNWVGRRNLRFWCDATNSAKLRPRTSWSHFFHKT